jgi:hypothetical protein
MLVVDNAMFTNVVIILTPYVMLPWLGQILLILSFINYASLIVETGEKWCELMESRYLSSGSFTVAKCCLILVDNADKCSLIL